MRSFFAFLLTVFLSVSSLAIAPIFANAEGVMANKTLPKGTPSVTATAPTTPALKDPENTLFMDLKDGRVVIELRPDIAPKHVARIKELVRQKFYDGLAFHRVIDGFMAQGGDPKGDGTGGSGKNIPAEFSSEKHVRGTASMARSSNPDSADSQFFICLDNASFLDGQYTAWGNVISGMEFVDHIKKGNKANNGTVIIPDKIVKMQVAADVKE
jgi:peptidylprolyl isomerase